MKSLLNFPLALLVIFLVSCGQNREVTRIDPKTQTDLSGRWNDTDARLVAEEMIKDCLSRPWLERFNEKNQKRPTVIVGLIQNNTHEHIDPNVFTREMEKQFINTGTVRVVQGGEFRERIREERADQQKYATPETQAQWGRELGADYMMTGVISSIVDSYDDEKVVFYKTNLELTDLETNEKVWLGDKEIKKYIED